jgi:addiction module RelE/StbE family toxin
LATKYKLIFSKQAKKDIDRLSPKLRDKARQIFLALSGNPYLGKALLGDLRGYYSYRLSYKDRIVYSIDKDQVLINILRVKTHYGD